MFEELEIESDISQIFHRDDIDVVNLNKAPIDMSHQVLYTGDLLFAEMKYYLPILGGRCLIFTVTTELFSRSFMMIFKKD